MNSPEQRFTRYIYLDGLSVPKEIRLGPNVTLASAKCTLEREWIDGWARDHIEEGLILINLPAVTAELRIDAADDRAGAVLAWNSMWAAVLIGAVEHCDVAFVFQCDTTAAKLSRDSHLRAINRSFRGPSTSDVHYISHEELAWLEQHFEKGYDMLPIDAFQNAVHVMWSYRWHTYPRARLALLWAGIEGLFGIESELAFRVSLYIARFLEPDDEPSRRVLFESVKRLYKARSSAVHGGTIKGDADASVSDSATLLQRLVRRCIELGRLPEPDALAP